jgi:5-methyltetrahydropteroyltriglutamate--homocysteine methyltransferase
LPAVTAPIARQQAAAAAEIAFARAHATRPLKATGPVTLSRSLADRYYGSEEALVLALADALAYECRALAQAGAAVIQIDEPSFHSRFSLAARIGHEALARMVRGLDVPVQVHV